MKATIAWIIAVCGLLYLMIGGFVYFWQNGENWTYDVYPSQVLNDGWGVDVSRPIPLQVGGSVSGSAGSMQAQAWIGLFSIGASASGQIEPSAGIKLDVVAGGVHYIFLPPVSKVRFHITNGPDRAKLTVDSSPQTTFEYTHVVSRTGSFWTYDERFVWGGRTSATKMAAWPSIRGNGLDSYLLSHVRMVDLYLTQQQYQHFLNA